MEQALAKTDPALLALVHGAFGKDGALQPFARETFLLECQIAGLSYRYPKEIKPDIELGTPLVLRREPHNPHDQMAIMVLTGTGQHLGYVPRAKNDVLARLMDSGKLLFAKLESKHFQSEWLRADISIYLRDF